MELAFLNPRLDAPTALEWGLINRVLPTDTFDAEVLALAQTAAAGPIPAFGVTKMLLNEAMGVDRLDYHLDRELENLSRVADTPDFAEGLDAFFGRRPPKFGGR